MLCEKNAVSRSTVRYRKRESIDRCGVQQCLVYQRDGNGYRMFARGTVVLIVHVVVHAITCVGGLNRVTL